MVDDVGDAEGFSGFLVFGANVAGGQEDGEVWMQLEEFASEAEAGHTGHGKVGDHGSEELGARAEIVESGGGVHVG
jgi:hypothetical protein